MTNEQNSPAVAGPVERRVMRLPWDIARCTGKNNSGGGEIHADAWIQALALIESEVGEPTPTHWKPLPEAPNYGL